MAGTWRVAKSLNTLLAQINDVAPGRSTASDGSIGDPAHRAEKSDHNPDDQGVVRARDFTHDPGHGADMHELAEALRAGRDRRITYVIWNRRIFSAYTSSGGRPAWQWGPYSGRNAHDKHMHVSVVPTTVADDTSPWEILMPLSNDDVKRIADATAARVLGKPWSIPGRTLSGSVEAVINLVGAAARGETVQKLAGMVAQVLAEVSDDPATPVTLTAEDRDGIAQRVAERLAIPTAEETAQAVIDKIAD